MDLNSAMESYAEAWVVANTYTPASDAQSHNHPPRQEDVEHASNYSDSRLPRDEDSPHRRLHSPTGVHNMMLHCVVEQCNGPPTFDPSLGVHTSVEKDSHVSLPSTTLMTELLRAALLQMNYSATDTMTAKGAIEIKNWKLLAFDHITDNLLATIGDMLTAVSSAVTLRIRICSRQRRRCARDEVKDKLLCLMLPRLLGDLVSDGCPINREQLASLMAEDCNLILPDDTRSDFLQWYSQQIKRFVNTIHSIKSSPTGHKPIESPTSVNEVFSGDTLPEHGASNKSRNCIRTSSSPIANFESRNGRVTDGDRAVSEDSSDNQSSPNEDNSDRPDSLLPTPDVVTRRELELNKIFDSQSEIPELQRIFARGYYPAEDVMQQCLKRFNARRAVDGSCSQLLTYSNIEQWFKNRRRLRNSLNQSSKSSQQWEGNDFVDQECHDTGQVAKRHRIKIEQDEVLDCSKSSMSLSVVTSQSSRYCPQKTTHGSLASDDSAVASNHIRHLNKNNSSVPLELTNSQSSVNVSRRDMYADQSIVSLARRYYSEDASEEEILLQKWFIVNPSPNVAQMSEYVTILNSLDSRKGLKTVVLENVAQWFQNARSMFINAISTQHRNVDPVLVPENKNDSGESCDNANTHNSDACNDNGYKVAIKREIVDALDDCSEISRLGDESQSQSHIPAIVPPVPPTAHTPLNVPHMPYPLAVHYLHMNAAAQYIQQQRQQQQTIPPSRASPQPAPPSVDVPDVDFKYHMDRKRRTRVFIDPITEIPKLESWFSGDSHPSAFMIDKFCEELNRSEFRRKNNILEPKNIQLWFKNHRAKVKRLKMEFSLGNSLGRMITGHPLHSSEYNGLTNATNKSSILPDIDVSPSATRNCHKL